MRNLRTFNTVKVISGEDMSKRELESLKYAGFMTLSQSGDSPHLLNGIIQATKLGVSCINIVNVEDSPITRVIQELQCRHDHRHRRKVPALKHAISCI